MENDLSITIVAYHNYKDIKNALSTIESYTNPTINKQIYIVDNSCIKSKEEVKIVSDFKKFILKFEDIKYFNMKKNLGFGKANNFVLPMLNSRYHAIVNPDVLLKEDSFTKIIKYLESDNSIGMCIPNIENEDGERQLIYRKELTLFDMFVRMFCRNLFSKRFAEHTLQNMDYTKPFQVPFGQGSFLVIKTELFKQLKGFDDRFFMYIEDADLCKRVNQISKLMYFPHTTIIHKWQKGSHKNKKLFRIHVKSMIHYFNKWGYKFF